MRRFSREIKYGFAVMTISLAAGIAVFAQPTPKAPPAKPATTVDTPNPVIRLGRMPAMPGDTSERSIKVDSNINLSLCITQGNLKVNGWNRNEVRVFVQNGTKFGFKVQQKSPKTGDPVWIMVTSEASNTGKYGAPNDCIWGDEIEIDAPVNASLNLKGQDVTTTIDGIRKVNVKNAGGDISVTNVTDGVTASTYRGDLSVEESTGAMVLESTNGNILAFKAGPSDVGDIFMAKTNSGAIVLQNVEHRQMEVNSISGTVAFNGELLNGGSYSFATSNGSIKLTIPQTTSCTVSATYGFGTFNSELPIKIVTENISDGPVKSVVGKLGSGDATLKLTTNNGSIQVKKQ